MAKMQYPCKNCQLECVDKKECRYRNDYLQQRKASVQSMKKWAKESTDVAYEMKKKKEAENK